MWDKFFTPGKGSKSSDASASPKKDPSLLEGVRVLKHAQAMRVVFFYPGEEGTYVDNCTVTLFENGIVHLRAKTEETTTHLHHCEILWRYEVPVDGKKDDKLRVVKFKGREGRNSDKRNDDSEPPPSN
jgi:hypothetical protein